LRRLVLVLYALVGPVFCASLLVLGNWREDPRPLLAVVALIAAGALWLFLRRSPRWHDWIFPVAIAPTVCCGIGFASCGDRGLAYLAVVGAPLAWAAVLFEAPVVLAALATAVVTVFVTLSLRLGVPTAAVSTLMLSPLAGLVAWVVFTTAGRLRESEERFRVAFRTSPDSININRLDDGVFVAVNEGFTRMTGWSEAEVLGRSSLDVPVWEDPADRARLVAGLKKDGCVRNLEAVFRRKDGSLLSGLMSARLIGLRGEPYLLSITRDISDWKRAEEEREGLKAGLHQAAKMEAIGQLAGGVAHDFNNLLTVILSGAEALEHDLAGGSQAEREIVDEIGAAGRRARDLTRQLLAFARRQVIAPVPLDLNTLVRDSERLLRRVLGEDVALVATLQPALWPVRCDPGQIEQVVLNLAVNARDAMPAGGRLTIETSNYDVAEMHRALFPGIEPGPYVRLAVHDSGTGMSPEVKGHVFEPFFTTKPVGKGTGLGLATVYGIVNQSGGFIRVESEPGYGTSFEVLFPRIAEVAGPVEPPAPVSTGHGTETVLVVEDDPQVRAVTVRSLRAGGYLVLAASDGREALELGAQAKGLLRLVVTDVVMPGLDGRALADELRRHHPELRVLYVSGHAEEAIVKRGVLDPGIEFLPKPFTASSLLARVRAVLDAG
jgi:PAS domain S-box-containing protein